MFDEISPAQIIDIDANIRDASLGSVARAEATAATDDSPTGLRYDATESP
jgi:hypothetical protein